MPGVRSSQVAKSHVHQEQAVRPGLGGRAVNLCASQRNERVDVGSRRDSKSQAVILQKQPALFEGGLGRRCTFGKLCIAGGNSWPPEG